MKKALTLYFIFFVYRVSQAQSGLVCPPNASSPIQQYCEEGKGISTNPSNPINEECPQLKNNLDWRVQNTLNLSENFTVVGPNAQNFLIQNPFTGPADAFYRPFISQQLGSNYQPADGWELIKVEFGTYGNRDNSNIPGWQPNMPNGRTPKLPYMILYNKYTGTMRFFGSLLEPDAVFKTIKIELRVPKVSPNIIEFPGGTNTYLELSATNLLSTQGESIQPLDQQTTEASLNVFVPYTNNPNIFFWFDAPMAYDPCVCNNRVQLDVSFSFVQTSDVEITGSLTGSIKTQTNSNNQDYGLMAFSRILAAGGSLSAAIASKGAIVNYKAFADLIDIFHDHHSMSAVDQQNLRILKNYASCSSEFLKILKSNGGGIDDPDQKKRVEAGVKIFEGSLSFMNSLTKDCSSGDNSSTVISGTMKASGTISTTVEVGGSRILLALPGSKWNDTQLQFSNYISSTGKDVPSYPTYNERLGTLAMLETPSINIEQLNYSHYFTDKDNNIFGPVAGKYIKIKLSDPLVYCFNPKMNIDLNKTKIDCRFLISKVTHGTSYTKDLTYSESESKKNQFYSYNFRDIPVHDVFSASSNFLPIEHFKEQPMAFLVYPGSQPPTQFFDAALVYVQLRVFLQSNEVGSNGEKNSSILYLTFPVKKNMLTILESFNQIKVNPQIELNQYGASTYLTDFTFNQNQVVGFRDEVVISGNIKTATGVKVKIYSLIGFRITPGASVSPDVELIVGFPFPGTPNPPVSESSISSFCANSSKYKANIFSRIALENEENSWRYIKYLLPNSKSNVKMGYPIPNPTTGTCAIGFDLAESGIYEMYMSNALGLRVKDLQRSDFAKAGKYSVQFNTEDLESGVYYITLSTEGFRQARKLVVVK